MSILKKLAGQTAIYGLSSMVGRLLFFLLTPWYTDVSVMGKSDFGVITELYAYVMFAIIVLTYGMETSFFKFSTEKGRDKDTVYSTILTTILSTSLLFFLICWMFSPSIASLLEYASNPKYIIWLGAILALDAVSTIPMARLRADNNAKKFAIINIGSILLNIFIIMFFIIYCGKNYNDGNITPLIEAVYNPEIGVGYIFIANLIASAFKFVLLIPEMRLSLSNYSFPLIKEIMPYAMPLLIFGFAGTVNEALDRAILKEVILDVNLNNGMIYEEANKLAQAENGMYGGVYKLAMILTIFLQAFRYAVEPLFFNTESEKDSRKTYSQVMTYFVITICFIFLGLMLFLHIFKYFIGPGYWEGIKVLPILIFANMALGIFWNVNMWFKLSKQTNYGIWLALIGAAITITGNFIFIPYYGYEACAWTTLVCYLTLMITSYFLGQKHYPIPYNLRKIGLYLGLAVLFYFISIPFNYEESLTIGMFGYHTLLLLIFMGVVFFLEKPKKSVISDS